MRHRKSIYRSAKSKDAVLELYDRQMESLCYLLKDRGHIHKLTDREKKMIVDFLIVE